MKCDFILHETRRIQHALYPHPLILKFAIDYFSYFICYACERPCGGFVYECPIGDCFFHIDVRCACVSEPFDYKIHEHPLFLALDPEEKPICHVYRRKKML